MSQAAPRVCGNDHPSAPAFRRPRPSVLGEGLCFGHGVDAGTGCFHDAGARAAGGRVTCFVTDFLVVPTERVPAA
ncbi:hypothetical protein ACFVJM_14265 [Streptomyces virginiae]|uniref:hypothetical protein n=1 Tax=Streptomyces virginiae TaxID=1961 RepID=UPI00362BBC09